MHTVLLISALLQLPTDKPEASSNQKPLNTAVSSQLVVGGHAMEKKEREQKN